LFIWKSWKSPGERDQLDGARHLPWAVMSGNQLDLHVVPRISSVMRRVGARYHHGMITTLLVVTLGIHFLATG
jgi:hypothetical protein